MKLRDVGTSARGLAGEKDESWVSRGDKERERDNDCDDDVMSDRFRGR